MRKFENSSSIVFNNVRSYLNRNSINYDNGYYIYHIIAFILNLAINDPFSLHCYSYNFLSIKVYEDNQVIISTTLNLNDYKSKSIEMEDL